MKLPPYGKSIDQTKDTVWIWAGEKIRVHQTVRTFGKNTVAFYPPEEASEYVWFVKNRDVVVVHFFEPRNFWAQQIILVCLESGASRVAELSYPAMGSWWNPHWDTYRRFLLEHGAQNQSCLYGTDAELTINNYLRS